VITLALDASTYRGTVAVLRDREVIAEGEAAMRGRDAEALMPCVAAVLERCGVAPGGVGRVVCGAGPGSFTSLRIAASIAKGIAFGRGCPVFAVSSLALILAADGPPTAGRWLAVLDALRGDVYAEAFAVDEHRAVQVLMTARLVKQTALRSLADSLGVEVVGPGQAVNRLPHARGVAALESLVVAGGPVELASWEPHYGRKAEAQVRWEALHERSLPSQ
jgi:tRNA threonylcarbamoyladenosine biosynthesis protein TsaB